MIFNYLRVSTQIQNTSRQLANIPCDREYVDKLSGKDTNRPQLQAMIDNLRDGDCIQVHSLDRLARNTKDLLQLIDTILKKGASVKFFKENLSFESDKNTDPFQKLMLTLLGAVSEFERSIILERQKEGIAIAKIKGKYKGYKGKLSENEKDELKKMVQSKDHTITSIAKEFNITRQSVYNLTK